MGFLSFWIGELMALHNDKIIKFESASARIKERDDLVILCDVYARKRGLGHGSGLMKLVVEYADSENLELVLQVRAYSTVGKDVLSNEQLIEFYKKFGFVKMGVLPKPYNMVRPSQEMQGL